VSQRSAGSADRGTPHVKAPLDEATLRDRCARLAAELPQQPALRRIAFVGALRCEIGSADMDSVRMTHGLDYLLRSDVVIAPDFAIDIVNLFHGRDFLAESDEADLVFVSFVPNVEHRLFTRLDPAVLERQRRALAEGDADARDPSFFWQARSQEHAAEAWRRRVVATGAHVVLTVGGRKEINSQLFESGLDLETLVPTPPYQCQPPWRSWTREQLYGVAWDIPYKWLGILASANFLRERRVLGRRTPATMLAVEMARRAAELGHARSEAP
jgi:hypothetical protein